MILESDADRILNFFLAFFLMPPFILLSYWALQKSKDLSRMSMMRVRVAASALLLLCTVILLWGFVNLIVAIMN